MKKLAMIAVLFGGIFLTSCSDNDPQTPSNTKVSQSKPPKLQLRSECQEGDDEDQEPMLKGDVLDSLNNPVHHGCVEIRTTSGTFVSIIGTDSLGHYYFNSVSNGSYNLYVSVNGYATKVIPFTISGTPQVINVSLP